jgi:amidase
LPTISLVSRAQVIPLAPSQDTLGPIVRTVTDAAVLLTVIAGPSGGSGPHQARPATPENSTKYLDAKTLAGARFGVRRKNNFRVVRGVGALMRGALADLKSAGAELVDPAAGAAQARPRRDRGAAVRVQGLPVNQCLGARKADAHVHSLAKAIMFDNQNTARELRDLRPGVLRAGRCQARAHR